MVVFIDFPPRFASIDLSRFTAASAKKIQDPVDLAVERFCRIMDLHANESKDSATEINLDSDLSRTNVEKELKTYGVTKNIELQQTLPNPSEKTRAKLRKVSTSLGNIGLKVNSDKFRYEDIRNLNTSASL